MGAPQTVAEVLDATADLLEKPGAWTQGEGHRDKDGCPLPILPARHPHAVCWCIGGALHYVMQEPVPGSEAEAILRKLLGRDFVPWNDASGRTQAEVVAKLREAATLARGEKAA